MLKEKLLEWLGPGDGLINMRRPMTGNRSIEYNLAGHILRVSGYVLQARTGDDYRTELNSSRLPLNAPHVLKYWVEYENKILGSGDLYDEFTVDIHALARQVWANEYGDLEAQQLPFYDSNEDATEGFERIDWWWDDLTEVDTDHVLRWLRADKDDMPYCINAPEE